MFQVNKVCSSNELSTPDPKNHLSLKNDNINNFQD